MVASVRQQYGLRIQGEEFAEMGWDEFTDLLAGLNEQTPLVRVVQIRTERDREAINRMTPQQRRMRMEWLRKRALSKTEEETMAFVESMQKQLAGLFGSGE